MSEPAGEVAKAVAEALRPVSDRLAKLEKTKGLEIGPTTPLRMTGAVAIGLFLLGMGFASGTAASKEQVKTELRAEVAETLKQYPNRYELSELLRVRMDGFEDRLMQRIERMRKP